VVLAVVVAPSGSARPVDLTPGVGGVVVTEQGPGYVRHPDLTVVFSQDGRQVARTRTDARGIFAVSLPAGRYALDAEVPDRHFRARMIPVQVWVPSRFRRTVRLIWDTGFP